MLRRMIAAVLLPALAACTTFGTVANPREYIPVRQPRQLWLKGSDGRVLVMYRPELVDDTLIGVVRGQGHRRIPRSEIQTVQARLPAPGRTRLLLASGALVLAVSALWVYRHTGAQNDTSTLDTGDQIVAPRP